MSYLCVFIFWDRFFSTYLEYFSSLLFVCKWGIFSWLMGSFSSRTSKSSWIHPQEENLCFSFFLRTNRWVRNILCPNFVINSLQVAILVASIPLFCFSLVLYLCSLPVQLNVERYWDCVRDWFFLREQKTLLGAAQTDWNLLTQLPILCAWWVQDGKLS